MSKSEFKRLDMQGVPMQEAAFVGPLSKCEDREVAAAWNVLTMGERMLYFFRRKS